MSTRVALSLEFNGDPAPRSLIDALQAVQVTCGDQAPSTFSLTFHDERGPSGNDFPLLQSGYLQPWVRVEINVEVNGESSTLINGYITGRQLAPGFGPGGTSVTVSGEDASVKMNMIELSLDYPSMGDFLIAEFILAKYALFRVIPDAKFTLADAIPFAYVPQQNSTDRVYLQQLAQKHGYRFYVKPAEMKGWSKAYWGPPDLSAPPQTTLTVDMGPITNVETIQFGENLLAPTITYGMVPQTTLPPPVPQRLPVGAFASTRSPPMATDPAMGSYGDLVLEIATNPLGALKDLLELHTRGSLFQTTNLGPAQDQSLGFLEALPAAAGITNDSTDEVLTAQGRLDTTRYGAVLMAPGVVAVRGAGNSCDGLYYVKQVQHSISTRQGSWSYTQDFNLTREGTGSTISEIPDA